MYFFLGSNESFCCMNVLGDFVRSKYPRTERVLHLVAHAIYFRVWQSVQSLGNGNIENSTMI